MSVIDMSDFEIVTHSKGPRANGGFSGDSAPKVRVSLHKGGSANVADYKQLCISLNKSAMSYARFVAGDRVNLMFTKDKTHMILDRQPKGLWTLSPNAASKEVRIQVIGQAHGCSIKLTAPSWAKESARANESAVVNAEDITSDGCRLLVTVNL